ncbi:sporulation kinase B homolog 2 [Mesobacillus boroniphilus JCM 21738]|uniref:histidine kinase n=1 Tax=Mesobacillus boroniphilus JCM 21738 TaxID=1294265 RepID=W4RQW3_9BACI|nr:histidine kinase dimerization/phospho-acceptor domain-containing protein [Mesobacillus boroniphilus]GAE46273.1 sporulation kinase B homolog 2 [Mesobacillus boroniphilus JCM 21738]
MLEEAINTMEDIFERTKLQQELQRAEKMNAIGQLAASVAHEIRNPMTVVKGFLQIFLSKEMSEEDHMYLKLMIEELNRAETIINDYLSLAKPDVGKLVIIDGSEMTEQVMDLMSSYAMMSKNISMHTEIKDQVKIRGNKSELKQVLINILKNGIEAMGDGGKLSMTLEKQGDFGVFVIKDTGIGMTAEELSRLGTAFYSLKERGTGMG